MSALAPFPAFPAIDRLVLVGEIEQNLIRLCRSIDSFEPISAVVGQAGVGKTLLGKLLNQQYHDTHRVITINDGSEDGATTILQHLVHTFEILHYFQSDVLLHDTTFPLLLEIQVVR